MINKLRADREEIDVIQGEKRKRAHNVPLDQDQKSIVSEDERRQNPQR